LPTPLLKEQLILWLNTGLPFLGAEVSAFLETTNQAQIASSRKSGLETKIFGTLHVEVYLFKDQPYSAESNRFRRERCHTCAIKSALMSSYSPRLILYELTILPHYVFDV